LWPRLDALEGHIMDMVVWDGHHGPYVAVVEDIDDLRYMFVYEWDFGLPEYAWDMPEERCFGLLEPELQSEDSSVE
jgi:hypothetical protein